VHCREELLTFVRGETESLPLTGEHKLYSSQIQKPFPEARSNQSNYHTNANTVKKNYVYTVGRISYTQHYNPLFTHISLKAEGLLVGSFLFLVNTLKT